MTARRGRDYLRDISGERNVWLNGERVGDVTTHPALMGAAARVALLYDRQHEQAERCLTHNPQTGGQTHASHVIPRSREDLARRAEAFRCYAELTLGIMGRSPDFMNCKLAGFAGTHHFWAQHGNEEGAARLVAFHKEVASRDLCLTHAITRPTVAAVTDALAEELVLHKVSSTDKGILVRGCRAMATLAPFADEIFCYPMVPIPDTATRQALAFSVPLSTPGLKILCRDSFSTPANDFDHAFSSSFDEQDAVVIFDDVEVPSNRVFLDGNTGTYKAVTRSHITANIMQQTTIRALIKLEFAYDLATNLARALNTESASAELLGELWTYVEFTRCALSAAELGARDIGAGTWFCDDAPFRALRPTLPRWFTRVNDIIKIIGGHNLLATVSAKDLAQPELRKLIEHYFRGLNGVDAETRIQLFRMGWDFLGSQLGGRNEMYERLYNGSSKTMYMNAHFWTQETHKPGLLQRLLDKTRSSS